MPRVQESQIDWERAFKLVALCHVSKENNVYYEKWFGYDKFVYAEDKLTDTEVYCFADGKERVIVFRGSDSFTDWFWNIFALKKHKTKYGKIHSGFYYGAYRILKNEKVLKFLDENEGDTYITGFSKGGAMAIAVAPYLSNVKGIYCFGTPRIGDAEYAERYPLTDRLFLFKNKNDLIPHLPPVWFLYRHIDGMLIRFKEGLHGVASYYQTVSEAFVRNSKK